MKITSALAACITVAMLLIACGHKPGPGSELKNIRDNQHVILLLNSFNDEGGFPGIDSTTVPIMIMKESASSPHAGKLRGYAIDCARSDPRQVYAAFGIQDGSTAMESEYTYEELVAQFEVDKQPVLKCASAGSPDPGQQPIKAIFRIIQDAEKPLPYNYLVKFAGFEHEFYSVGCQEFFRTFNIKQDLSTHATPVLASTLQKTFPDLAQQGYKEINCISDTTALPQPAPLTMRPSAPFSSKDTELRFVVDRTLKKYLLVSNSLSYSIQCPSVPEREILKAFRFAANYQVTELTASDPLVASAARQPALRCSNPLVPQPFSELYVTKNETVPSFFLRAGTNDNTLLRFGCSDALQLFPGPSLVNNQESWTLASRESIDFLIRDRSSPTVQTRILDIPCKGDHLIPEPNALKDGEVISLSHPHAPATQKWLDGITSNGDVQQIGSENTGMFWRVAGAGENNSFHLQSMGRDPGVRFLACSNQNDSLRLVGSPQEVNYETRWSVFRGENGLRFACRSPSGEWRWIQGNSGRPALTHDEGLKQESSWTVRHHRFYEDNQIFHDNEIVSLTSLLTRQDKRWLASYPGKNPEIGLETSSDSPATRFQVVHRKDASGFSLKAAQDSSGDRVLECRTSPSERWYQLASHDKLHTTATTFRAYRLSETNFPFIKLVCFDAASQPYWMAFTGQFPWMDQNKDQNVSAADALLYAFKKGVKEPTPGARPREERISQIDFIVNNTCGHDIPFSLLYVGANDQWTTQSWHLRKGESITVPVRNQWTYWYGDYNVNVNWTDVRLLHQGSWQRTVEFHHNYHFEGGSWKWSNRLMLCR